MSGKLFLLYAAKTGNVLAAVSMAAPPDGDLQAGALAGDALLLRNLFDPRAKATVPGKVAVPVAELAVLGTDPDDKKLADPLGWRIGEDKSATELPNGPFATLSAAAGSAITITIPVAATAATPVLLWVQNAAGREQHTAEIAVASTTTNILLTGGAGTYNVLALVQGYPPIVQTHTI